MRAISTRSVSFVPERAGTDRLTDWFPKTAVRLFRPHPKKQRGCSFRYRWMCASRSCGDASTSAAWFPPRASWTWSLWSVPWSASWTKGRRGSRRGLDSRQAAVCRGLGGICRCVLARCLLVRHRYYTHEETVNNIVAAVARIYCKCILNNFVRREGDRNRVWE